MSRPHTDSELEAYLDEALTPGEMSVIESAMRDEPELAQRLMAIISRRDAGIHTIGEIWRRHRVSCPTREQLGSFLLKAASKEEIDYITFHIEHVGCRLCAANLEDLQRQQAETEATVANRREKYFQSSAGYLGNDNKQ